MSVIVLDAGNSIIKAKTAGREKSEVAFSTCNQPNHGGGIWCRDLPSQDERSLAGLPAGQWDPLCGRGERRTIWREYSTNRRGALYAGLLWRSGSIGTGAPV